jgi:iron(III) transport system permease protein
MSAPFTQVEGPARLRIVTADERLAEASTAALAIVAVGLVPMVFICRQIALGRTPDRPC